MKVAIYCRLSEEDRNKQFETDDSNSIQNQKKLLTKVAKEKLEALSKFSYLNELEFYGVEDTRTT